MIFVRDKGRMCNNILQYGHVYAWARAHGRQAVSMRFAYKYQYFHICHTPYHHFATYVAAKYAAKWGLLPVVSFDTDGADYRDNEQKMLIRKHLVVEGWYARWYDLFLKYKAEIIRLFAFTEEIEAAVARRFTGDGLRLGVHIRRGDYATFQGGRFLYSDAQYVGIIRQFIALHPRERIHIYICGNDPKLDRAYFAEQLSGCEVSFPEGNPGEDLCLLSHCHYLIGAPSTFSLVAAMYHDLPLYWIEDASRPLTADAFGHFDELFRHIY